MHPPVPADIMHDLQKSSEDGVTIKRRIQEPTSSNPPTSAEYPQLQNTGVKNRRALASEKENLNV